MGITAYFRIFLIAAIVLILSGCGSNPSKPYGGALKPVENHGRTADAVNYPKQYEAFGTLSGKKEFDKKWVENPGWILANMSHAAYFDRETIANRLEDFGIEVKYYQDEDGGEAFLAIDKGKAFLSFRGTDLSNFDDLLIDAKFFQKKYKGAYIHKGFLEAIESLWNDGKIEEDLKNLGNRKIYATGHSLGGAMAVIASMNFEFEKVVTFGEPRIGTNLCSPLWNQTEHIRFVNGNDLVTNIPPESPAYIHYGKEFTFR